MKIRHQPHQQRQHPEDLPNVVIFWLIKDCLLFDRTPIQEAEVYGHFRIHPRDHLSVWVTLQALGKAPNDREYEELPRGRVVFNANAGSFIIYADSCVLRSEKIKNEVRRTLRLPKAQTKFETGSHYHCYHCLHADAKD